MKAIVAIALFAAVAAPPVALAERVVGGGVEYECVDGMCRPAEGVAFPLAPSPSAPSGSRVGETRRLAQGWMGADDFVAFLRGEDRGGSDMAGSGVWAVFLLALLGGLAMNLTPCVLPMVPVNVIVIGASAARGAWYGAGIVVAYGALGVAAALGGLAFGAIQSSPWFNALVAAVFAALAFALFGAFRVDFSSARRARAGGVGGPFAAFALGALGAVLAGACVAPVLVSALLVTADWFARGRVYAVAIPFAVGLGMALPWPFVGAGLKVLPRPGAWMKKVNFAFGVVVLCFAAWYARLSLIGFSHGAEGVSDATPATFADVLAKAKRPVLVDCWASWCKNCSAMERGTLRDPRVVRELDRFDVIRLRAEDIGELKALPGFSDVVGLPAFLVVEDGE